MAVTPELNDYVQKAHEAGLSDDVIRAELLKTGWNIDDVNAVVPPRIPNLNPLQAQPSVIVAPTKKHSPIPFIITIVVLLLAGGAIYYFLPQIVTYADKLIGKILPAEPVENLPINQMPVVPIDETAGWQTYRNEEYGFEFKHRPTSRVEKSELLTGVVFDIFDTAPDGGLVTLSRIVVGDQFKSPESFRDTTESVSPGEVVGEENITVDGNQALLLTSKNTTSGWSQIVVFVKGDNFYQILNSSMTSDDFESFYSTFKLSEIEEFIVYEGVSIPKSLMQSVTNNFRFEAEIYISNNSNSYVGLCENSDVVKSVKKTYNSGNVSCKDNSSSYAFSVRMWNGQILCLDNNGYFGVAKSLNSDTLCVR